VVQEDVAGEAPQNPFGQLRWQLASCVSSCWKPSKLHIMLDSVLEGPVLSCEPHTVTQGSAGNQPAWLKSAGLRSIGYVAKGNGFLDATKG
jgi:hypothetical protein